MVRYRKVSLWDSTMKNFKAKKQGIDKDLALMGIRKRVPLTTIVHLASTRPLMLGQPELVKLSKRRKS